MIKQSYRRWDFTIPFCPSLHFQASPAQNSWVPKPRPLPGRGSPRGRVPIAPWGDTREQTGQGRPLTVCWAPGDRRAERPPPYCKRSDGARDGSCKHCTFHAPSPAPPPLLPAAPPKASKPDQPLPPTTWAASELRPGAGSFSPGHRGNSTRTNKALPAGVGQPGGGQGGRRGLWLQNLLPPWAGCPSGLGAPGAAVRWGRLE